MAKPDDQKKVIELLKQIIDKLEDRQVIPALEDAIRETQRLARGLDRMVPDNTKGK